MKSYRLAFGFIIIVLGCSNSFNSNNRNLIPPKKYPVVKIIDSSIVAATVKPFDYKWNEDGNLIDIIRKKYEPHRVDPKYPDPFSPPSGSPAFIMFRLKSDYVKFYFCNDDESSCYKFQEGYFEEGNYSLGFQKLNIDTCVYGIKIEFSDTTIFKKVIYMP